MTIREITNFPGYGSIKRPILQGFHVPLAKKEKQSFNQLNDDAVELISSLATILNGREVICVGQGGDMVLVNRTMEDGHPSVSAARQGKKLTILYDEKSNRLTPHFELAQTHEALDYDPSFTIALINILFQIAN